MRRILLGSIQIKYLAKNNFEEYIKEIEAEDISNEWNNKYKKNNYKEEEWKREDIWNQIQEIILNNIQNINIDNNYNHSMNININKDEMEKDKKKYKLIKHEEGKNFEGIIKYLEDKYGKDIHQQGIINITASSSNCNIPEQVINYGWDSAWYSDHHNPGEWWEINFKEKKVKMNGYSLKTYRGWSTNSYHLKNWVIEGRNEGGEWKEIDRQDNNDLNGPSYQHYYSIGMTEPYQYFRIKCIGEDHYGYTNNCEFYTLAITNFEIYGAIKEND